MAVFLKDLYYETKALYKLSLISGSGGMDNIVKWVYVSEDTTTTEFLKDDELIITTGVASDSFQDGTSCTRSEWLKVFIKGLIKHNTSGLIINTGKYIFENDITDDIIRMCKKYNFPLFTMPWETRVFDITHDYYDRIFKDSKVNDSLSVIFRELLTEGTMSNSSLQALSDSGFTDGYNNIFCIMAHADENILHFLHKEFKKHSIKYHICILAEKIAIIINLADKTDISSVCSDITHALIRLYPDESIYSGTGSICAGIDTNNIRKSYNRAVAASQIAACRRLDFVSYNNCGLIKLLLEINDKTLIDEYISEQLGAVINYDKSHNSDLTETLRQYLLLNGSVQNISSKLFCHRNTVNYRLRIIKEDLGYRLGDSYTRFQLMAAYELMKLKSSQKI